MIVSAQPFYNEIDLLEIKFRELGKSVDVHIVVEATRTFTGIAKPLYFDENRERFREFNVEHVVVELPEKVPSAWDREYLTQRAILGTVRKLNPEIAIWSDTDECPRGETVSRFREMKVKTAHVDMDNLLFFFDRIDVTQRPTTAKIGVFDPAADHQPWRGETQHPVIHDAGWHFSYFGGKERLLAKLNATCHSEEPGAELMKVDVANGRFPGIERTAPYQIGKLPRWVVENRGAYDRYFSWLDPVVPE